eukprot:TRINITY_DN1841_c0_g1_i2.p1 TRINITY_DN1841_c0_g1~~TRINITY_DN1841_c0_g1_i2.p1  ORF type:complete len:659 (+),score=31.50 TRINITY_DN1841_c0_g1_i2:2092-4068(+)
MEYPYIPEESKAGKTLPHLKVRRFQEGSAIPEPEINPPSAPETTPINEPVAPRSESVPVVRGKGKSMLTKLPRPYPKKEEMDPRGIEFKAIPKDIKLNPSALSNFTSFDQGNATPRYFRCTHQAVPTEAGSIIGPGTQPFGALVQPLADSGTYESPMPFIEGEFVPRCTRCGAYMNPDFLIMDYGNTFKCNLCESVSSLSAPNPKTENKYAMYEVGAPKILQGKPVDGHNIILLLDCSHAASSAGLPLQVLASIKGALDYIPDKEHFNLGVVTYGTGVSFYIIAGAEPSVVQMNDIMEPFAPIPKALAMLNLATKREEIDVVLDKVSNLLTRESPKSGHNASCGGAALKAAVDLLKGTPGRVLWFALAPPNIGVGVTKNRSKPELWNSEKETVLLKPDEANQYYSTLSQTCIECGIGVDLFACGTDMDLATLSQVATSTGGEVYYYPGFFSVTYGEKLYFDLFRNLTRTTVYDVSLKARCSLGLSISKYLGSFGEKAAYSIQLPVFNSDKTLSFCMKYNGKLKADSPAFIQFAILYTTASGQRRIRVFNYTLVVTDKLGTASAKQNLNRRNILGTRRRNYGKHTDSVLPQLYAKNPNKGCKGTAVLRMHQRTSEIQRRDLGKYSSRTVYCPPKLEQLPLIHLFSDEISSVFHMGGLCS